MWNDFGRACVGNARQWTPCPRLSLGESRCIKGGTRLRRPAMRAWEDASRVCGSSAGRRRLRAPKRRKLNREHGEEQRGDD